MVEAAGVEAMLATSRKFVNVHLSRVFIGQRACSGRSGRMR